MAKTSRVEYLIDRLSAGEITDDEWREIEDIVGRPSDYTPIIPGTDYDPIPAEPDMPESRETREWLERHRPPPRVNAGASIGDATTIPPIDPSLLDYDARLKTLEHAMTEVMGKLKALETRLLGEKT